MALNTNKDLKTFYSIAEVSEMFGISASNLRFWEKEFPSISPKKSGNKVRQYTKDDIEEIRLVYDLVKVRNMKLSTARELLHRNKQGAKDSNDLMERLQSVRSQLIDIKQEIDSLL
ncbi:MAG: MerR family transcriptional regulator [Bacteroidaceae bacterium]|nr:MerR family transcriptional regulator [Bacteroidaceae bacterium]